MDTQLILNKLREEVKPALGCTEPVVVALAAAHAFKALEGQVKGIKLLISSNIYKNAKAVGIPGTGETGVEIAAALGVSIMRPTLDLTIFSAVQPDEITEALKIRRTTPITIEVGYNLPSVYVEVEIETAKGKGKAIIAGTHTNLVFLSHNQQVLLDKKVQENTSSPLNQEELLKYPLEEIIKSCMEIDPDSLVFLADGVEMNLKIAQEGLRTDKGLKIGKLWESLYTRQLLDTDLTMEIARYTAAACDARMSGVEYPVMSSSGSGNQGLMTIIPIVMAASERKTSRDVLLRALAISHLVTFYIKEYIGRLSPVCGCAVGAGAGVGAGTVYLLGGEIKQIISVIKNIISTLAGMICDGGKVGCALKLCTTATTAWYNSLLALEGLEVPSDNGIIAADLQQTLENLKRLSSEGMKEVDRVIVSIQQKNQHIREKSYRYSG